MTHTFAITGMHCQSCVGKVTGALKGTPGVADAAVSLSPPEARVEMTSHVSTETLDRAVQAVGGYHLSEVQANGSRNALPVVDRISAPATVAAEPTRESLYPLFLIVGYILGAVLVIAAATGVWTPTVLMRHFMAGFFLVFSFFKLLDLRGFADAYQSYDVLAKCLPAWAFVYPFVELALGVAYLLDLQPTITSGVTLALMLIGAVGVLKALLDKRAIRCACLGTALNLPMTKVTLFEDLGMAAMAAAMLAAM